MEGDYGYYHNNNEEELRIEIAGVNFSGEDWELLEKAQDRNSKIKQSKHLVLQEVLKIERSKRKLDDSAYFDFEYYNDRDNNGRKSCETFYRRLCHCSLL